MTCNYRRTLFRAVTCICLTAKRVNSKFAVYDFKENPPPPPAAIRVVNTNST
jgi:hypothetical protein